MTEEKRLSLIVDIKMLIEQIEKDIADGWTADAFVLTIHQLALAKLQDEPVVLPKKVYVRDMRANVVKWADMCNALDAANVKYKVAE